MTTYRWTAIEANEIMRLSTNLILGDDMGTPQDTNLQWLASSLVPYTKCGLTVLMNTQLWRSSTGALSGEWV
jgi:hypothetical protein